MNTVCLPHLFPVRLNHHPSSKNKNNLMKIGKWAADIKLFFSDWSSFHCSVNSLDLGLKSSPARLALLFPLLAGFGTHHVSLPVLVIWSQLVSTATVEWMIPLFKTFSFSHIIAKILFTYRVLYLLLMTRLSFLVCSSENNAGCKAGKIKIMAAWAALQSPALFLPYSFPQSPEPCSCEVLSSEMGQL